MADRLVAGVVELGTAEDGVVAEEVEAFDVVPPPVVGLSPVVGVVVALPEDLQADVSETEAIAVPAARMAALFKNCLLEYLVTRKMAFLP